MASQHKRSAEDGVCHSREVVVENTLGLHARPASMFVRTAQLYEADITIGHDGHVSDGKSIIGVLMLGAASGSTLQLTARGADAVAALDALEALFKARFDEE